MDLSKDTLAFARERRRMCVEIGSCRDCMFVTDVCVLGAKRGDEERDKFILEEVQAWSDTHSQDTYLMDFLEKFPNCAKNNEGIPELCRAYLYPLTTSEECYGKRCDECWKEPMEE